MTTVLVEDYRKLAPLSLKACKAEFSPLQYDTTKEDWNVLQNGLLRLSALANGVFFALEMKYNIIKWRHAE